MYSVAVCLAAYNGEKYILEQVNSILSEISESDVLYVADDCSTDSTLMILAGLKDSRVKIIKNEINIGYVSNFQMLVNLVDSDYIFFSDQDDVWIKGRVKSMIEASAENKKNVIFGRFNVMNATPCVDLNDNSLEYNRKYYGNILRLFLGYKEYPYFGSTLMITREAKKYLFPMSSNEISHDIWIAIFANLKHDVFHMTEVVTKRRVHESNLTKTTRNFIAKVKTRLIWLKSLLMYGVR